jgi:hypothetical protein
VESIVPLSFNALATIESARATLKTFFEVFLDLNVYKRDLEQKCIEQDENVIRLTSDLHSMEARLKFMVENGGQDGYAQHVAKQEAIKTVLNTVNESYIDHRDVEHLGLNKSEQQNLTKLSLSKIVSNLQNKLKEQEVKNQNMSLKLDQAIKQKEIYKSRFDELKAQQKNTSSFIQTVAKNKAYEKVESKLTSHTTQNTS